MSLLWVSSSVWANQNSLEVTPFQVVSWLVRGSITSIVKWDPERIRWPTPVTITFAWNTPDLVISASVIKQAKVNHREANDNDTALYNSYFIQDEQHQRTYVIIWDILYRLDSQICNLLDPDPGDNINIHSVVLSATCAYITIASTDWGVSRIALDLQSGYVFSKYSVRDKKLLAEAGQVAEPISINDQDKVIITTINSQAGTPEITKQIVQGEDSDFIQVRPTQDGEFIGLQKAPEGFQREGVFLFGNPYTHSIGKYILRKSEKKWTLISDEVCITEMPYDILRKDSESRGEMLLITPDWSIACIYRTGLEFKESFYFSRKWRVIDITHILQTNYPDYKNIPYLLSRGYIFFQQPDKIWFAVNEEVKKEFPNYKDTIFDTHSSVEELKVNKSNDIIEAISSKLLENAMRLTELWEYTRLWTIKYSNILNWLISKWRIHKKSKDIDWLILSKVNEKILEIHTYLLSQDIPFIPTSFIPTNPNWIPSTPNEYIVFNMYIYNFLNRMAGFEQNEVISEDLYQEFESLLNVLWSIYPKCS